MTQEEFIRRFKADASVLEAWGRHVSDTIRGRLGAQLGSVESVDNFLKVPPTPRVKAIDSIVAKAFYRGKCYADSYEGITDKVGVRFVVLLLEDVKLVSEMVASETTWRASKDRDFEEERLSRPLEFTYQSVHYVVKACSGVSSGGVDVPEGTPCEVQIRTLLQHAYSELAHNTTYKPRQRATPEVHRAIARSMALIEAADGFFQEANDKIDGLDQNLRGWFKELSGVYRELVGGEGNYDDRFNLAVIDAFTLQIKDLTAQIVRSFLLGPHFSFLIDIMKSKKKESFIHRQPLVLLLYYMIDKYPYAVKDQWPMRQSELEILYADMGRALP